MSLAEELARAVPGLAVSDDPADRIAYARDLYPRHHLAVRAGRAFERRPGVVAWPRSTADVSALVRFAGETGHPVVPFGAGSGVAGGIAPGPEAIVLDMKRMARWRTLDKGAPSLDVEAGHMGMPLEERLGRHGLTLGHFPSSILCSTVGGWIAARSAGQASGYYGKIEDMVLALECVTGEGEVARLSRRARGPDLVPLVVGSEGTLAVVTSATLRLHPAPRARAFGAWSLRSLEQGWDALRRVVQAGLRPAVARLYDPFDAMLAKGARPHDDKAQGADGPGLGAPLLRQVLRRPALLNALLRSRVAERAMGGAMLLTIFEDAECDASLAEARRIVQGPGVTDEGEEPARRWLAHRYAVSFRQAPIFAMGGWVDTMEVAARWSHLGALYDGVRAALGEHVFVMAHLSHAYPDGCCIYFSFAGSAGPTAPGEDARDWDARCEATYDRAWKAALRAAVEAGGTLSHHHGVGRSKATALGHELGTGVETVRALMRVFDPKGILNPGNLLPRAEASA